MNFAREDTSDLIEVIHDYLKRPFWPEHLAVGQEFSLQADDQDGDPHSGWITIKIIDRGTITVETAKNIPDPNSQSFEYYDQKYLARIDKAEHPYVFQAVLYLALAFSQDASRGESLGEAKSRKLKKLYRLLIDLPWLPTLQARAYLLSGDVSPYPKENCALGVIITECNDDWLSIGYPTERFRNGFGGGGGYRRTCSALRILAEAIRLEKEEGIGGEPE